MAVALLWLLSISYAHAAAPRPNILFIMVDDLGKEWISCYGAEGIQTPNIDKLAATGMKFNNAWCIRRFAGMVRYSNKRLGRVVRGGKAKMSEQNGTAMPFIVSCPGTVPAGIETDALIDFSDMLPTFAELGGGELPKGRWQVLRTFATWQGG
ncbi:sulfatase-like hydrolase/transferase [Novipirellula artificiosorum]|nr:sulfatase-like hydrolase/transferase [Novipirellula artificiosorum]